MGEEQAGQNLIDTTDSLEAIGVCRCWKNFLFIILILSILLLQGAFWVSDLGYVKTKCPKEKAAAVEPAVTAAVAVTAETSEQTQKIEQAAKQVTAEPNQQAAAPPAEASKPVKKAVNFKVRFKYIKLAVKFLDFVLILAAVLYCLTMLFIVKISLLGRLGGINHICRAFFLSLVMLVLLLPWQKFFDGVVAGAIYTPQELFDKVVTAGPRGIFAQVFHYVRFVGYWILVLLFLIFSHIRSGRWARAILRRLEVV